MASFLLLLHQTPGRFRNLSPEEIQKILGSYIAWRQALVKQNKMRAGEKLTDDGGRHLRTQGGNVSVTDGPYSESQEILGGFFMIEAANYDEAVATYRQTVLAAFQAVEDDLSSLRVLEQQATLQSVEAISKNTKLPSAVRQYWTGYGLGLQVYHYDVGPGFGHGGNIRGFSSNAVYLPGHGNDFAIEVVAPLIEADSAFDSSNRIATASRADR